MTLKNFIHKRLNAFSYMPDSLIKDIDSYVRSTGKLTNFIKDDNDGTLTEEFIVPAKNGKYFVVSLQTSPTSKYDADPSFLYGDKDNNYFIQLGYGPNRTPESLPAMWNDVINGVHEGIYYLDSAKGYSKSIKFTKGTIKSYSKTDPTVNEFNSFINELKSEIKKIWNDNNYYSVKFRNESEAEDYVMNYPVDDILYSIKYNSAKELAKLIMYTP